MRRGLGKGWSAFRLVKDNRPGLQRAVWPNFDSNPYTDRCANLQNNL